MRETTCFIVSMGHGEPAMMPVRSEFRSNSSKRGWPSSAMNIVGTPCSAVQRSSATALSAATGSNASPGNTIAAPVDTDASTASTMPKQWYSGTGMHSESSSEKSIAIAMKRPLLTTLWCVSVAPFGLPVVPLVNWMLIGSWAKQSANAAGSTRPRSSTSA